MNPFWSDLHRELEGMDRTLAEFARPPADMPSEAFRAHEQWSRAVVDAACLRWARTGTWPDMTPETMWWATLRLCQASKISILLSLACWDEHPSRRQALTWLLVDAWPLLARDVAEADARAAELPDGMTPMPPPDWLE